MQERIDKERINALSDAIKGLKETMKLSAEQAVNAIQIPEKDKAVLLKWF